MNETLYKGFVPTKNKKSLIAFKDVSKEDLLTLEEAQNFSSYAGVLNDNTILIDIDDTEQSDILLRIVREKQLKCKVIATTRGKHFLFWNDGIVKNNRTHCKLAIGLIADIKGCSKSSYEVLRNDGVEREVLYDTGDYQTIPKWLTPVNTNMDLLGMVEGDGRNNALFSYILPLQQNDFSIEECRECITIISICHLKKLVFYELL